MGEVARKRPAPKFVPKLDISAIQAVGTAFAVLTKVAEEVIVARAISSIIAILITHRNAFFVFLRFL